MRKQTDTCLLPYNPFHVRRIGTRADANIHKAIACKYSSNNICTVVEECQHGYFCLGYFSSSTHFDLVMRLAQKAWRQCVLVFAHDLGSRGGNCNGLLSNTGFFLSTGNRYLFLLQRRTIPLDSSSLLLVQFSHAWRQIFVIEVFDRNSSSPWFSTSDSWEPISSDESPFRIIPKQFRVDQTHVFSIFTVLPRFHLMEFF